MDHEVAHAQTAAAEDLVGQGLYGLLAQRLRWGGEVDEIGRVRGDMPQTGGAGGAPETPRLQILDLLAYPAAVVLDEDLEYTASRRDTSLDRARRPPGDGLVRADREIGYWKSRGDHAGILSVVRGTGRREYGEARR